MNRNHVEALSMLGFVHERLATADPNTGHWFTPADQYYGTTTLRVVIPACDDTTMYVFTPGGQELAYKVTFTRDTPLRVVNQAVASAMEALRSSEEWTDEQLREQHDKEESEV